MSVLSLIRYVFFNSDLILPFFFLTKPPDELTQWLNSVMHFTLSDGAFPCWYCGKVAGKCVGVLQSHFLAAPLQAN